MTQSNTRDVNLIHIERMPEIDYPYNIMDKEMLQRYIERCFSEIKDDKDSLTLIYYKF